MVRCLSSFSAFFSFFFLSPFTLSISFSIALFALYSISKTFSKIFRVNSNTKKQLQAFSKAKHCSVHNKPLQSFPTVSFLSFVVEIFDNYMQQDAHEFLNCLLNTISETLAEEKKNEKVYKSNGTVKRSSNVVTLVANYESRTQCQPGQAFTF